MTPKLRVVIADDERPARSFLAGLLRGFGDVDLVGEAENGARAVELIESERPDLALLDLQMPELDGVGVVRVVKKHLLPLVAFVTAYDEFAVKAFELNAVDYLLKPVSKARLRETLNRATDRLERAGARDDAAERVVAAVEQYQSAVLPSRLERIPARHRDQIVLVPVAQVASVVADGELLHLTTVTGERHVIAYRLKDLEARLEPGRFVRLNRGAIANVDAIATVMPMPGGTYTVELRTGERIGVSRAQSRILRETLLRL